MQRNSELVMIQIDQSDAANWFIPLGKLKGWAWFKPMAISDSVFVDSCHI